MKFKEGDVLLYLPVKGVYAKVISTDGISEIKLFWSDKLETNTYGFGFVNRFCVKASRLAELLWFG